MEFSREYYLNKLISKRWNKLIKVITGIRRCGKSYFLFEIFKKYLLNSGVKEKNIIEIQLDRRSQKYLRDPDEMVKYVSEKIEDDEEYYLFIDEIQMADDFVSVLNEFLHYNNLDVYVTGSNSKMLSKDIITEFRGRGDELRIHPLTIKEIHDTLNLDFNTIWKLYAYYGGMPQSYMKSDNKEKSKYLIDLLKETYVKDIKERNGIRFDSELQELIGVLSSSVGSLINPNKLLNTFKSEKKISISPSTIINYLIYLEEAFIIEKSIRYDVKGKKYINTPFKYYFSDIGIRNSILNFRQIEEPHIMENIVYNELRSREYLVDVGCVEINERQENGLYKRKQLECDFIVYDGAKKYYIQSAYTISDREKYKQEIRSLQNINDSFKKIVIVKEDINIVQDNDGIILMSLKDFLLNKDSLNI